MPSGQFVHLNDLPHATAREAARSGAPAVLLVNPVEYHGPHLSLHNDHHISFGLAGELARALPEYGAQWLYAGDLEMGVEPASGPGSRHTPYATVRDTTVEACARLAELGVKRVVLLTFHGAPMHNIALWAGIQYLRKQGVQASAPLNVLFRALLEEDVSMLAPAYAMLPDEKVRRDLLNGARTDLHAGYLETSLTMHFAPQTVGDHQSLPDCPPVNSNPAMAAAATVARLSGNARLAAELELVAFGLGWAAVRPHPGYTGRPALASAEAGRIFAGIAVEKMAAAVRDVFERNAEPTPPLMEWIEYVTLRGRVGDIRVPLKDIRAF